MLAANGQRRRHLVGQSLRRRVADPAAVGHTYEFSAELQDVGQRQVADVGVLLTATNATFNKLNQCTRYAVRSDDGFNSLDSRRILDPSVPF